MPNKKAKITKTELAHLRAGETLLDAEVGGFKARKAKDGICTFSYNAYIRKTGKYQLITIGTSSDMSPQEARAEALVLKAEAKSGTPAPSSPNAPAPRRKKGETLRRHVEKWLADPSNQEWSDAHRKNVTNALDRELLWRNIADAETARIRLGEYMEVIDEVRERSQSSARLFYAALSPFLQWAHAREFTTVLLPRGKHAVAQVKPRQMLISDDEILELWKASRYMAKRTGISARLLLLTCQRSGALQQLHRDQITCTEISWPAELMKMSRDHYTALTPWAFDQIRELKQREGYVFRRYQDKKNVALTNAWPIWRERAGVTRYDENGEKLHSSKQLKMHDIRRSVRTWAAVKGFEKMHCEAAIAHDGRSSLEKTYDLHDYREEAAEVLRAWQKHLQSIVDPRANVRKFTPPSALRA